MRRSREEQKQQEAKQMLTQRQEGEFKEHYLFSICGGSLNDLATNLGSLSFYAWSKSFSGSHGVSKKTGVRKKFGAAFFFFFC
jgi:hypothetical protein